MKKGNKMNLLKEEQILYNHYKDMYQLAQRRGIPVYSNFAGINEINIAYRMLDEQNIPGQLQSDKISLYGGYKNSERCIICFMPDFISERHDLGDFPISCIKIEPANKKFCGELTHRDYLGTIMSLGIEREQIGDIVVKKEGEERNTYYTAYVFCKKSISELILGIEKIKNTTVKTSLTDAEDLNIKQDYKELKGTVASPRMDAIISVAIKTSRSKSLNVIREGKVYLNGRCCTENAKIICNGDIITVRGHGKFLIEESQSKTKKGNYHIIVKQYI